MKIRPLSDLHFEFINDINVLNKIIEEKEDDKETVLILSGDICYAVNSAYVLKSLCKRFKNVVVVLGNHDYYGESISGAVKKFKNNCVRYDNLIVLNNESVEIDGVTIAGCTMWSDFLLYGKDRRDDCKKMASIYINDYKNIKNKNNLLGFITVDDTIKEFEKSYEFLSGLYGKSNLVIVTHHGCSPKSISSDFAKNELNPSYYSNLEELIVDINPKMWIHGHTHRYCDYEINNTRVLCNPYGYYKFEENGMYRNITIDI